MARSNTANSGNTYYDLVIQVLATSDASYTLRAVVYLTSLNVTDSSNSLDVWGGWSRSGTLALNGVYNAAPVWYQDIVVNRVYGATVTASVAAAWSGVEYWGVTLSAGQSYVVPARPYSVPAAPTGVSAARNSDTSHTVTWTNHPTTAAPYTNVVVQRSEDDDGWATIATVAATATSYTNTTTSADHAYVWRVIAGNSSGYSTPAASITLYTTPAAPGTPSAVKSGTNIVLTFTNTARFDVGVKVYESQNGGAFNLLATVATANLTTYTHVAPSSAVTHAYRVATYNGTLISSQSAASNTVQLLAAPNAPTGLGPSTIRDAADAVTWHWTHNPVDSSSQTAFQLRHRPAGGAWTTVTVTSGASTWTLAAGTYANPVTVEWQVCTKGAYADYSPWSATASSPTSTRPTATISTPADGGTVTTSTVTVEWVYYDAEATAQASWQVELLSGAVVVESQAGAGAATSVVLATVVADGSAWTVRVRVTDSSGMVSTPVTSAFTVSYALPSVPLLGATWHPDTASVALGIDNPFPAPPRTYAWTGTANASASSEIVEAVTGVRTNLVTNPSFEVDLSGLGNSGGTLTRDTAQHWSGTASARFDTTTAAGSVFQQPQPSGVANTAYTASAYVRGTGTVRIWLAALPGGGTFCMGALVTLTSEWQRITVSGTSPAGATNIYALIYQYGAGANSLWIDGLLVERSATLGTYFDGSTTDVPGATHAWTGTANASTSTETLKAARVNLCTNPGLEGNTTGWAVYSGASLARVTTEHHTGVASGQVTTAAAVGVAVYTLGVSVVVATGPVTASAWVKVPAGSAMRINVKEYTPTPSLVGTVDAAFTGTGAWQRVSATKPVVTAGNTVRIEIDQRAATAQVFYVDDALIEQGATLGDYFDGATPDYIGEVDAVSNDVWRSIDDGPFVLIATGVPVDTTITDWAPTVAGTNHYRVDAVSALPSVASSAVVDQVTAAIGLWISGGPGFSQVCRIRSNVTVGINSGRAEKVLRYYAGRDYPVEHAGTARTRTLTIDADILSLRVAQGVASSPAEWEALADLPGPHLWRDLDGRYVLVSLSQVSMRRLQGGYVHRFSVTATQVDHD